MRRWLEPLPTGMLPSPTIRLAILKAIRFVSKTFT